MTHKVKHLENEKGKTVRENSGQQINGTQLEKEVYFFLERFNILEKKDMGKKNRHYIADWLVIIAHKSRLNFVKASGVQLY